MMDTGFSYGKLLIQPRERHRSIATVYVSQPPAAEAQRLGRIFFVGEIALPDERLARILDSLADEVTRNYYGTDDLNTEKAFERSLEFLNHRIADLIGDADTNWLDHFGGLVAAVTTQTIYMSTVGPINAFLIRHQRITDIIAAAGDTNERQAPNPLKAFSNIISGDAAPDDVLMFTTPSVLDYFSLEKLRRTVSDRHPSQAASQLQSLLMENENRATFAAALVQIRPMPVPSQAMSATQPSNTPSYTRPLPQSPAESMQSLLQKQADTGNILTPSLTRYLRERIGGMVERAFDFMRLKLFRQSPRRVRLERDLRAYQAAHRPPARVTDGERHQPTPTVIDVAKKVSAAGAHVGKGLRNLVGQRKQVTTTVQEAPRRLQHWLTTAIKAFQRLPRVSKILLGLAIIIAFALSQGLYSTAMSRFKNQESIAHDQLFNQAEDAIIRAQAAISYDNMTGAQELLNSAETLLADLEPSGDQEESKRTSLQNQIATERQKTYRIVNLENPRLMTDLATTGTALNPIGLVQIGDVLYSADSNSKTVYRIAADGNVTSFPNSATDHTWLDIVVDNKKLVLLGSNNSVDFFNTETERFANQEFKLPAEANIVDTATYLGRYYLLDIRNNQILRANAAGNGYAAPTNWITDGTEVSRGTSLAIDGSIYVGQGDGSIIRLTSSIRQEWSVNQIEPALSSIDTVWTGAEADYLYLLNRSSKRIVVITKNGSLVRQFTAASFDKLTDLSVSADEKQITVLNGTAVVQFANEE
ncbi:MAG: hypothetical protein HZC01_00300 [Candidatus Kerfeldbacteria bacterium]|nr:hypothetical protein [Candidatus Kerfeldbacteria bacterium]